MPTIMCKICEAIGLFRCGGCRDPTIRYCSRRCQSLHWREEHKQAHAVAQGTATYNGETRTFTRTFPIDPESRRINTWNGDNFRLGDEAGRASRGDFRTDAEALAEESIYQDSNSSREASRGLLAGSLLPPGEGAWRIDRNGSWRRQ
jgi:hypothetical protein